MCGLFGIVNLSRERDIDEDRFWLGVRILRHRGPDAERVRRFGNHAVVGHVRLSIIDVGDQSNQPLSVGDRYWIVYNGEIFNYIELRNELMREGVRFETHGDTEVLLQAYIRWGEQCVERFNGMWAFAIYDTVTRDLFCSRDRFGEKPFCYTIDNDQLLFASEIKAILAYKPSLAVPEYDVIANFCRTSVGAQQERTWFKNIVRLQPGHYLTVRNGRVSIRRYWRYPKLRNTCIALDDAQSEYRRLFEDAVRVRMRSDVPLGLTLSSGVDSNSIAYSMFACDQSPHHCFTSRFKPEERLVTDSSIYAMSTEIDEYRYASEVARELNLTSHAVDTDYSDMVSSLQRIIFHLESGNSSPAVVPLMQLLSYAKGFVRVLLDGQGADELLGGYIGNLLWPVILDLCLQGRLMEAREFFRDFSNTYQASYAFKLAMRDWSNEVPLLSTIHQRWTSLERIYGPLLRESSRIKDYPDLPGEGCPGLVSKALMHQHSGGLVNLLHYGDALSMANGIESRMPFLDHRLVEFVWSLPDEFKVNGGIGKYIHRKALGGLVPEKILWQKTKYGFNTPIGAQFKKSVRAGFESVVDVLLSERCAARGVFNREGIQSTIVSHISGEKDHGPLLFRLLSVELWFRQFIDKQIDRRQ